MSTKFRLYAVLGLASFFLSACARTESAKMPEEKEIIVEPNDTTGEIEVVNNIPEIEKVADEEVVVIFDDYEIADMYSDPMLMNPTENSVDVVWFTDEACQDNEVLLYERGCGEGASRVVVADTVKMSRLRGGDSDDTKNNPAIVRDVYRHCATVGDLPVNDGSDEAEVHYCVRSDDKKSNVYTLCSMATEGVAQKILITSDHQNKEMCSANIQKAFETVPDIDAVFVDGDMADVPDRTYDWFDSDNSFFKVMQGRASHDINGRTYTGAPILQNVPIFTAIGNHEVMGVYSDTRDLSEQFNNPTTREYATKLYNNLGSSEDKESFIRDNSFNTITYEELFGDKYYYSFSIGDARVIVLEMARIWRLATIGFPGKYSEIPGMGEDTYGFGQFIFEPIDEGSRQYDFLKKELESREFQEAKYKIVMYHFDNHSLGSNCIPAYTEPVRKSAVSPITGQNMIVYDYPIENDIIANLIEPLMEKNNVDLVINGHSHIWNRFVTDGGMNILESSNVGNNYGGYVKGGEVRTFGPSAYDKNDGFYSIRDKWDSKNYILQGDPQGLEAIMPNIAELPGGNPYLASNTVTAFSILDTGRGVIDSYYFDTEKPDSEVVLFDSFEIRK